MTSGLDAEARVNPWDFVLSIEGALTFAGTAVRRLEAEARGSASFPFHVAASGVGVGTLADGDEGKGRATELWLPLWPNAASAAEIKHLFAEGRIELGQRRARNGVEAARALASLGVDRGIDRFHRIGILQRNGLSYLASSLGTLHVRSCDGVGLMEGLDSFVEACRRLARPAVPITQALRRLQTAMFDAAQKGASLTEVLAAAGALERAVSRSPAARDALYRPLGSLDADWASAADDSSAEFAVALAIASWGIRSQLEPVDDHGRWSDSRPLWIRVDPLANTVAIAERRLLAAEQQRSAFPLGGQPSIGQDALARLLAGAFNRDRLTDLIFGLSLLSVVPAREPPSSTIGAWPDASFALLRAVTSPVILAEHEQREQHPALAVITKILSRLRANDPEGAIGIARRRLQAHRFQVRISRGSLVTPRDPIALAAGLVVPLPYALERRIVSRAVELSTAPGGGLS